MDHFVAKANEGHVRGLYQEDGIALYVNAGTGQWAGFPTRLGVMPEVSLLILKSTK
jgi:predicted MPP superfamily phosphohydrolase